MKSNFFNIIIILTFSFFLNNCTTYNVKKDINKDGELKKTPRWYVKYKRQDKKWMYETATSVSPDLELSVKKSIVLAKAKLADRYNGKINNELKLEKTEKGSKENLSSLNQTRDEIVNSITETLVKDYIVEKVDVFYTHNKSYRSYVKLKISRENINIVLNEIKDEKNLKIIPKNYKDKNSFKNYLNNLFNL